MKKKYTVGSVLTYLGVCLLIFAVTCAFWGLVRAAGLLASFVLGGFFFHVVEPRLEKRWARQDEATDQKEED